MDLYTITHKTLQSQRCSKTLCSSKTNLTNIRQKAIQKVPTKAKYILLYATYTKYIQSFTTMERKNCGFGLIHFAFVCTFCIAFCLMFVKFVYYCIICLSIFVIAMFCGLLYTNPLPPLYIMWKTVCPIIKYNFLTSKTAFAKPNIRLHAKPTDKHIYLNYNSEDPTLFEEIHIKFPFP